MTAIQFFWLTIALIWVTLELRFALSNRNQATTHLRQEQDSEGLLWLVICLSLAAALWLKERHLWSIPLSPQLRQTLAFGLFVGGLCLRFYAVVALGRFFTTRVGIQDDHVLIKTGPYRYVRHPSYTGLLGGFTGAGLAMGDFFALCALLIPLLGVLHKRIEMEERWLQGHFGQDYRQYCRHTRKLIPFFY